MPFQNVPSAADGGMIVNAEVRVVQIYGEPWFVAKDVTSILGFKNGPAAIAEHVLPDQRADIAIHDGRQNRIQSIISESGLYRLIMRSNVPDQAQRN